LAQVLGAIGVVVGDEKAESWNEDEDTDEDGEDPEESELVCKCFDELFVLTFSSSPLSLLSSLPSKMKKEADLVEDLSQCLEKILKILKSLQVSLLEVVI